MSGVLGFLFLCRLAQGKSSRSKVNSVCLFRIHSSNSVRKKCKSLEFFFLRFQTMPVDWKISQVSQEEINFEGRMRLICPKLKSSMIIEWTNPSCLGRRLRCIMKRFPADDGWPGGGDLLILFGTHEEDSRRAVYCRHQKSLLACHEVSASDIP